MATNDLKRKYCRLRWQEMLLGFRQRPTGVPAAWDGVGGQEFEEVDRERLRGAGVALPDEIMSVGGACRQRLAAATTRRRPPERRTSLGEGENKQTKRAPLL